LVRLRQILDLLIEGDDAHGVEWFAEHCDTNDWILYSITAALRLVV
jgi:hypothetical protein